MSHRPRPSARRAAALAASAAVLAGLTAPMLATPAAAALGAPVPSASAVNVKDARLSWSPVAGATSYVVQVGQDDEWSDTPTLSLTTVSSSLELPTWLPHADYTWRVAAVQDGVQGPWSANGTTFTRSWLTSPAPASPVGPQDELPTFRWSPVASASEYQVQVSSLPFGTPTTQYQANDYTSSCFTTRTFVTPFTGQKSSRDSQAGDCDFSGMPSGTGLHWRVRALDAVADAVEEVDTTPVVDEGISSQPPAPPQELDTDACPEERPEDALSCEPANDVEKGGWSEPRAFSWDLSLLPPTPAAELPVVAATIDDAECVVAGTDTVCTDVPLITWDRPVVEVVVDDPATPEIETVDTEPTSYRVYVGLDAAFSNIQSIIETPGTSWVPTAQWRVNGVGPAYYYAVQACLNTIKDADGTVLVEGGCGPVAAPAAIPTFRKKAVAVTGLESTRSPQENRLTWTSYAEALRAKTGLPASSEAAAYRVQVTTASDPGFLKPVEDVTVDGTSYTSRTTRLGDGAFLWRVQAVDASGHKLPWSAVDAFRRDYTGPKPVTSSAAVKGFNPLGRLAVGFDEDVVGASSSTVALLKGGSVVPSTITTVGKVVYLKPTKPLVAGATYSFVTKPGVSDKYGNAATTYTRSISTPTALADSSTAIGYTGKWSLARGTAAIGGSFHASATRGSQAIYRFHGTGTTIVGCKSPASGLYEVWVDGKKRLTADAYRSYSGCGNIAAVTGLARGEHVVQVKVLGTKRAASKGVTVGFDGFRVTP